jgi:hypothetical protein
MTEEAAVVHVQKLIWYKKEKYHQELMGLLPNDKYDAKSQKRTVERVVDSFKKSHVGQKCATMCDSSRVINMWKLRDKERSQSDRSLAPTQLEKRKGIDAEEAEKERQESEARSAMVARVAVVAQKYEPLEPLETIFRKTDEELARQVFMELRVPAALDEDCREALRTVLRIKGDIVKKCGQAPWVGQYFAEFASRRADEVTLQSPQVFPQVSLARPGPKNTNRGRPTGSNKTTSPSDKVQVFTRRRTADKARQVTLSSKLRQHGAEIDHTQTLRNNQDLVGALEKALTELDSIGIITIVSMEKCGNPPFRQNDPN